MHTPIISVIIPAHNEERFIGRAIRSVLNQSIDSDQYEIIAINDASSDRTAYALDLFAGEIQVLHNEKQLGLPGSLNRGIKHAKGKYILRVDADDFITGDCLYILRKFLEDNKYMDAIACDYLLVNDQEEVIKRCNCVEHPIGCGIMFRIDHLIEIGLYDDNFLMHEDRDMRIRFQDKFSIHRLELPLYRYRQHEGNMTNDQVRWDQYEERLREKHETDDSEQGEDA